MTRIDWWRAFALVLMALSAALVLTALWTVASAVLRQLEWVP